jgi:hypothetical protein
LNYDILIFNHSSGGVKEKSHTLVIVRIFKVPFETRRSFFIHFLIPPAVPFLHSPAHARKALYCVPLPRELGGKDVDVFNGRRLRKQLARLCHQRRCHFSCEMRLATGLIWKGIKYPKGGWSKAEAKPGEGGGLIHDEGKTAHKKVCDLFLFFWLCFKTDEQGYFHHDLPPVCLIEDIWADGR